MIKKLIYITSFCLIIFVMYSCRTTKRMNYNGDGEYIIKESSYSSGSIDPEITYYYISNIDSLSYTHSYRQIIFECRLEISACCRDLKLNKEGKDLSVDFYFSTIQDRECIDQEIFHHQKAITIKFKKSADTKVKIEAYKVSMDFCRCHGEYTGLNGRNKDSIFIFPYRISFMKINKEESKKIKNELRVLKI